MTNLTEKIDELQAQMSVEHLALVGAIEAQTTTLVASLTSITTALATAQATRLLIKTAIDLSNTRLNSISTVIGLFRNDNAANMVTAQATRALLLESSDTVVLNTETLNTNGSLNAAAEQELLSQLIITLELLNNNGATNARYIASALQQLDFCCINNTVLPQLPGTAIVTVNSVHCQRVQAVLDVYRNWIEDIATVGAIGNSLTGASLGSLLLASSAAAATAPPALPVIVAGLIIATITTLSVAFVHTLSDELNTPPLLAELRQALYNADTAAEADTAFSAVIDNSSVINAVWKPLLKGAFYSFFYDLIYDTTTALSYSSYSGTLCAPAVPAGPLGMQSPINGAITAYGDTDIVFTLSPFREIGDLYVTFICYCDPDDAGITAPVGYFQPLGSVAGTVGVHVVRIFGFYRIIDGTEANTVTVSIDATGSSSFYDITGIMIPYRNASIPDPQNSGIIGTDTSVGGWNSAGASHAVAYFGALLPNDAFGGGGNPLSYTAGRTMQATTKHNIATACATFGPSTADVLSTDLHSDIPGALLIFAARVAHE